MKKNIAVCCALLLALVSSARAADFTEFNTVAQLTPSSARQVFFLNIEDLLKSPLVKKYASKHIASALKTNKESKKFFAAIGLDPIKMLENVESLYLTNDDASGKNFSLILSGKFDEKKIRAAAVSLKDPGVKGLDVYRFSDEKSPIWALLDEDHTLVISNKKTKAIAAAKDENSIHIGDEDDFLYELVQSIYGKKSGRFRDDYSYYRSKTMWWAGDVTEDVRKKLKNDKMVGRFAGQIHAFAGFLDVSSEIRGELQIVTSNLGAANKLKTMADAAKGLLLFAVASDKKLAPLVKQILDKVQIRQIRKNLNITFTLTETMVEELAKLMP